MIWLATDHLPASVSLGDVLGFLPHMLDEDNPDPAAAQINANYAHGGGWRPIKGFTFGPTRQTLQYPGDPVLKPLVETRLRDEAIYVYDCAIVCIVQPDGTFEAARCD